MIWIFVIHHLVSYTCLLGTYEQLPSPSWHLMPPSAMLLTLSSFHSLSTWFPRSLHADLSICLSFHLCLYSSVPLSMSVLRPAFLPLTRSCLIYVIPCIFFFNLANYSSSSNSPCANFFFLHRFVIFDCPPHPTPFHCAYFLCFPLFSAAVQNRARTVCQM